MPREIVYDEKIRLAHRHAWAIVDKHGSPIDHPPFYSRALARAAIRRIPLTGLRVVPTLVILAFK